jgi:membrane-associated protease RseP (regulator of RpoE activity)
MSSAVESPGDPREVFVIHPPARPYWLHLLLFLVTALTTTIVGAKLQYDFNTIGDTYFLGDNNFFPFQWLWTHPRWVLSGVPFSATLLGILFAHEMGHFFYSVKHRVYATLPFFLPFPSPIGTFGAFIKIKSPFRSRAALLDIGIAGPIAGFLVAVPLASVGLYLSGHIGPDADPAAQLGNPLVFRVLHSAMAAMKLGGPSHVPLKLMALHPIALAAWVGMLATSLNLIPGGQLDGGHIIFAWRARTHRQITYAAMAVLVALSVFCWSGWTIWIFALWFTRRHPPVPELPESDGARKMLLLCAVALLALTFMPTPIPGGGLKDELEQFTSIKAIMHPHPR